MFDDSHISTIYLNSRNILNYIPFKNNSTEELKDIIEKTVKYYNNLTNKNNYTQENAHLILRLPLNQSNSIPEERINLKFRAKLFMYKWDPSIVTEAVNFALKELHVDNLDVLTIAFPEYCRHKTKPEDFKPIWCEAEKLCDSKNPKVISLGVSDLNKSQLETLTSWARVKPSSNQINSILSCIVPEDLTNYADENGVALLTHNDKYKILSDTDFQDCIKPLIKDCSKWKPNFVLRYVVSIKCREVLKEKGYMIKAIRH
ncbi:unnamed protein product [Gordionus sp. m RMFG-2023]|uniref:glutamate--cysteine ligase regulatory subunit-like n=1 Tax=Gordionus sp. m RMFG-2023 TaxID=3053472 RepID=UPI0030E5B883